MFQPFRRMKACPPIGIARGSLVVSLALLLSGCVSFRDTDVVPFEENAKLEDFVGDYQNWTIPERPGAGPSISDAIWHGDRDLRNERVRSIEVRLAGPKTLRVRALGADGQEMKSGVFVEGKDFTIRGGQVHMYSETESGAMGFYPMGPMAMVAHRSVSLGIVRGGDAQQVTTTTGAGIFLIVPYGGSSGLGTRFARIRKDEAR